MMASSSSIFSGKCLAIVAQTIAAFCTACGLNNYHQVAFFTVAPPTPEMQAQFSIDALLVDLQARNIQLSNLVAINQEDQRIVLRAEIDRIRNAMSLNQKLEAGLFTSHTRSMATTKVYADLCEKVTALLRDYDGTGTLLNSITDGKTIGQGQAGPNYISLHTVYANLLVRAEAEKITLNKFMPLTKILLDLTESRKESSFDQASGDRFAITQTIFQQFHSYVHAISAGGTLHISDDAFKAAIVETIVREESGADILAQIIDAIVMPAPEAGGFKIFLHQVLGVITDRARQPGVKAPVSRGEGSSTLRTLAAAAAVANPNGGGAAAGGAGGGRGGGGGVPIPSQVLDKHVADFLSTPACSTCSIHPTLKHSLNECHVMFRQYLTRPGTKNQEMVRQLETNRVAANAAAAKRGFQPMPDAEN